ARFTISREPAVVNHGPARTSPTTRSTKPTSSSRSWPPMAPGLPTASKYASTAMPASSGMIRTVRGDRDADHGEHDVDPVQREIAFSERRSGEGDVVEQRSEDEEESEADCNA